MVYIYIILYVPKQEVYVIVLFSTSKDCCLHFSEFIRNMKRNAKASLAGRVYHRMSDDPIPKCTASIPIWLVVLTILKNMKVNGKDDIPYIMEK